MLESVQWVKTTNGPTQLWRLRKKKQWPAWYSNPKDEEVLHICLTNNSLIGIKSQLNKSEIMPGIKKINQLLMSRESVDLKEVYTTSSLIFIILS